MANNSTKTIGMDLGDKRSFLYVVDNATGDEVEQAHIPTTIKNVDRWFAQRQPATVVIEIGTHSGWVSRVIAKHGHEVLVADARQVRNLAKGGDKDDPLDGEFLARLGRADRRLLKPIKLRTEDTQIVLGLLRARDNLVQARTQLINHVRGSVKAVGVRLPKCSSESFHKLSNEIPKKLRELLNPTMICVDTINKQIHAYDQIIESKSKQEYPETAILKQVSGVGPVTALAFVLTIEDPNRFAKSRTVGAYLGLTRSRYDSGESKPELGISKRGDELLRRLLVNCAHYILGPHGPDSDLRRWGLAHGATGGSKNAKKRAVVAVARRLAVLLHRLWTTGEQYDPLYNARHAQQHEQVQAA
jgi:transposase